jgi:hypothetical protein
LGFRVEEERLKKRRRHMSPPECFCKDSKKNALIRHFIPYAVGFEVRFSNI